MRDVPHTEPTPRFGKPRWKRFLPPLLILILLAGIAWPVRQVLFASQQASNPLVMTTGTWNAHNYDLVYTVALSTSQRPDGPLVAYRASGTDLNQNVPIAAVQRDAGGSEPARTPIFFPSPDGRYLALLTPLGTGYATNLNGGSLEVFSSDGVTRKLLLAGGVAETDQLVWSRDSSALYYHTGQVVEQAPASSTQLPAKQAPALTGNEEIHRLSLDGQNTLLWQRSLDDTSMQLIGIDSAGELVLSMARPGRPVELWRLAGNSGLSQQPERITTLPADILPGNILRIGSDGASVNCLRITGEEPLTTTEVQINFSGQLMGEVRPLFATRQYGVAVSPLARSTDGQVLVMAQVTATRTDLAAEGIPDVPRQEKLLIADSSNGATQSLPLPEGGQLVQAFWSTHISPQQIHAISPNTMKQLFIPPAVSNAGQTNASIFQQDEWMLEAHAGLLADSPRPSRMCYGSCPHGLSDPPHVSAAIMHGMAYVESNWHQFNTSDYRVGNGPVGSPIQSFDGGWGEFQQTWGMPPQCQQAGNCRGDVNKIQYSQSYNIGVGAAALIDAWNGTAGVTSGAHSNDPFKANHWFFAVWAYNGAYGNNPIDVPSNHYAHWYPGAPFHSVYEEYVWYFAAHSQYTSNRWTTNYLPGLGPALLPPQRSFLNTSDSFVRCVTCTIDDWTTGTYDRDWVGQGASDGTLMNAFRQLYSKVGGEQIVGLPIDTGGGASVHRSGKGWLQNMGGGSFKSGALMVAEGTGTVYWIYGGVWTRYSQDKGASGCHGYPTSSLGIYKATDSKHALYIQNFQHGYIVWDATAASVSQDVC